MSTLSRRQLFLTAAAALLPRVARSANPIVRSARPEDLEMPLDAFLEWITPVDQFFVRSHVYAPQVELTDWSLKIDGIVNQPLTLSMADLKKLPRVETVGVLECAGNGRSFYEPHMAGAQWKFGAVGNGRWAGVRLRDLLQKAGVKEGAKEVLFDGADVPLGKMPDFQRTITLEKCLHPDTLLVYEQNGQPLTPAHGFPLRVMAPGWAGDSWVKWLTHIQVLDHEFDGFWMKTAYRHPAKPVAPGTAVDPKDMIPVSDLNVKSVIASPDAWAAPGKVKVQGAAWSNASAVAKVEVSIDGGQSWKNARLSGPKTKYGWRLWTHDWQAAPGDYKLIARATNEASVSQPLSQEWNPSGYLWNVAQHRTVTISNQHVTTPAESMPEATQPAGYKAACMACHDEGMMRQQRLTQAQWDRELNKMTGWGASMSPEQRAAILDYLTAQFHP